jgi:hypothetical protein
MPLRSNYPVSAIPTKLKVFPRPTKDADISGVMTACKPPEDDLRNEITEILNKITDSETLLFCLWMFKKIANHEELPPPEELKALQGAFVRMLNAMRDKTTIKQEDLALMLRYTDTSRSGHRSTTRSHDTLLTREEAPDATGCQPTVWFSGQMVDCIGTRPNTRPLVT